MLPVAVEAMSRELARVGNASSLHGAGRAARRVVEESRERIAACLRAQPAEVIFTAGGTESDNLAVKGSFWAARAADPARRRVVTSTVEHHAVLDSVSWLARHEDAEISLLEVDAQGRIDLAELARLGHGTEVATVSVIWANNEVGAVQPIRQVAAWAASVGACSHSDAVQAVGHLPVDFAGSGLDLLTLTAHKLGGPYGIGALLARRETPLTAVLHGGGQERDVRSGTLDVPAIAGFAAAVEHATATLAGEAERLRGLRAQLLDGLRAVAVDAVTNGPAAPDCLPGIVSVSFPDCDADALLMLLDRAGIDSSTGSACSAGLSQPSHVLTAMGRSEAAARSTLRFSLGHSSTAADIAALLDALPEALRRARLAGRLSG